MLVPNRHGASDDYRYGFNGKEKDDELKGEGNSIDFGARILDSRVGRWFARDPKESKYPNLSPYNTFENNPTVFKDPDGKDAIITVRGNNITVKAVIYIDNSGKNKINIAQAQRDIMKVWGGNHKDSSGKYNVKFDIVVMEKPASVNPFSSGNFTGYMPDIPPLGVEKGSENIVIPQAKGFRSNVHSAGGNVGEWEADKRGTEYAHEVGHMLGLDDLYTDVYYDAGNLDFTGQNGDTNSLPYDIDNPTELMVIGGDSDKGKTAKVSKRSIDAIRDFALKNQKNGKAYINTKNVKGGLAQPTASEKKKLDETLEGSNWHKGKKPESDKKKG